MAKTKVKKTKDPFDKLSDEFKDAVAQSSPEEIKKRISQVTLLDLDMKETLKKDGDVASAREALRNLMSPYREDLKAFKLQLDYCRQMLENKGAL